VISRQTSPDLQSSNTHQRLQSSNANQACVASQSVPLWPATTPLPLSGNLHPSGADTSVQTSDTNQPAGHAFHASTDVSSMSGNLPGQNPEALLPTKMCSDCCRMLPLTDFRFRNRAAGTRMCQCNRCHTQRNREREQIKRAKKAGWDIHKTASQIATSKNLTRSLWLLDQLVDAMGGPQKLVDRWREECWKLTRQKRSSTRLSRMYEMLIAMACQTRGMPWNG